MTSDNELSLIRRIFGLPQTIAGRVAVYLCVAFLVLFGTWLTYSLYLNPIQRPTFFSDPVHAVLILSAAASGVLGALFGGFALIMTRERSLFVVLSFIIGALVIAWTIGEMIGD